MPDTNAKGSLSPPLPNPLLRCAEERMNRYAVVGDLSARRGKIVGIEPQGGVQTLTAEVPLSAMFGYATEVRSATQGRATYTMEFGHYAAVPSHVAESIVVRMGA